MTGLRPRVTDPLLNVARGLLMGAFDVVPGVSGGTVALVVGIYERLITAIGHGAEMLLLLVRGRPREAWERLRDMDWSLLLPLFAGIVLALLTGARLIPPLLEAYPVQSRALFAGLILASLAVPLRRVAHWTAARAGAAVVAAAVAFVLVGLPPAEVADPPLLAVLGAAMVAITAMILPGVSGSFLLLALGMYTPTLTALDERDLVYIAVFVLGAVLGLALVSRLLTHLLTTHHDLTMAVLLGLMTGSLRALWPWQTEDRTLLAPGEHVPATVGLALLGMVLVGSLVALGKRRGALVDD